MSIVRRISDIEIRNFNLVRKEVENMLKRVNDRFIKILNKLHYKELKTTNFDEFTSDIDATIASLVDLKETDKKKIDEDFLNDLEALVDEIYDNNWDIDNLDFDDINKRLKK